jgi:sialate O-acetylesterase
MRIFKISKRLLRIRIVSFSLFLVFSCTNIYAQLKVAGIFGDNAVLQQGVPLPIWGTSKPLSEVIVSLGKDQAISRSDEGGKWMCYLPAMKADGKAYKLHIESKNERRVTYSNIMIGEVWFAAGQSNMEYRMGSELINKDEEIKNAQYHQIRFRIIDNVTSIVPASDISQKEWKVCTPENAPSFSAVAYFFARSLHEDLKVPVGIIVASRGATSIQSWMSKDRLITHVDFLDELKKRNEDSIQWVDFVKKSVKAEADRDHVAKNSFIGLQAGVTKTDYNDTDWNRTEYPLSSARMGYGNYWGLIWVRKSFELTSTEATNNYDLFLPIKDQSDHVYLNEKELKKDIAKMKEKKVSIPAGILKTGKNTLALRMYVNWGVADIGDRVTSCYLQAKDGSKISLEGEWCHNNTIEPSVAGWQDFYNKPTVNFNAMVHPVIPYGIRGFLWYQGENNASKASQYAELQPMLIDDWRIRWQMGYLPFLFVQLPNYKPRFSVPVANDDWAQFRDAQKSTLSLSPKTGMVCTIDIGDEYNIHPPNKQEVGRRLYLIALSKVYNVKNIISSGPMFKAVRQDTLGVRIEFLHSEHGFKACSEPIAGFALADSTGKWYWAEAKIDGNTVVVYSKGLDQPTRVQYAWQSNPEATLCGITGLPVVPFNEKIIK